MIEGIDLNRRIEFVSQEDKSDPKTVFILRPMAGSEHINLSGFYAGGKVAMTGDYLMDILRKCVTGTRNPDLEGEELKTYLEALPPEIIVEVGGRITDLAGVSDDERKNS